MTKEEKRYQKALKKEAEYLHDNIMKGKIVIHKRSDLDIHVKRAAEMAEFKANFFKNLANSKFLKIISPIILGVSLFTVTIPQMIQDISDGTFQERMGNMVEKIQNFNFKAVFCKHEHPSLTGAEVTFPDDIRSEKQAMLVVDCDHCGTKMTYYTDGGTARLNIGSCIEETTLKITYDFNRLSGWKERYEEYCYEFYIYEYEDHQYSTYKYGIPATC